MPGLPVSVMVVGFTELGRPALKVGSTIPWVWVLDYIKEEKAKTRHGSTCLDSQRQEDFL